MWQGDAPITSWDSVGQVCAGRALAVRQQGTCPSGLSIRTERNPGAMMEEHLLRGEPFAHVASFHPPSSHVRRALWLVPHFPGEKTEEGMARELAQGH